MAKTKKKPAAKKPTNKPAAKKSAAKKPAAKKPAAKKPAAKKPAAKAAPKPAKGLLRGAALAEASLAERRKEDPEIAGMSADELEAIDLGGKALSPSLKVWLAGDSEFFTLGQPQSFAELIEAEFPEMGDYFAELGKYLTEPVVLFEGWGSDSRRMIYLGATDEQGEYPVFTLDTDDTPFVCLNGPVDVWLAQQAGALEDEETYGHLPKAYEPTRTALAKKCFGGYIAHLDGEFSKQLG